MENWEQRRQEQARNRFDQWLCLQVAEALIGGPSEVWPEVWRAPWIDVPDIYLVVRVVEGGLTPHQIRKRIGEGVLDYTGLHFRVVQKKGSDLLVRVSE